MKAGFSFFAVMALVVMSGASSAPVAHAQASGTKGSVYDSLQASADQPTVPLVSIRYNVEDVAFEKLVHTALSSAVAIKPQLQVSLISYVPEHLSSAKAAGRVNALKNYLIRIGIPQNRIAVQEQSGNSKDQLIQLYVE